MFRIIVSAMLAMVPLCCSAAPQFPYLPFAVQKGEEGPGKNIQDPEGLEKFHNDILVSTFPFCRFVEWSQEPTFFFYDPYGNWGIFGYSSEWDVEKEIVGVLWAGSYKRPLPSYLPFSTVEEGIALLSKNPSALFGGEGGNNGSEEYKVLASDEKSFTLGVKERDNGVLSITVMHYVLCDDWLHVVSLTYTGIDEFQYLEFQSDELPILIDWFKKLNF